MEIGAGRRKCGDRVTSVEDDGGGGRRTAKQSQDGFCHDLAVSSTHSEKADRSKLIRMSSRSEEILFNE